MNVLIAVVYDLFQFARSAFSGAVPYVSLEKKQIVSTETSTDIIDAVGGLKLKNNEPFKINEQYFVGAIGSFIYHDPVLAFDNALKVLDYGQNVRLVALQGRWAQVRLAGMIGWVFKDSLVLQADDVYPRFGSDVLYDAHHSETIKLRACIDDMFGGARGDHDLSATEYVHYRLMRNRLHIDWVDARMRIPGTWQKKLRGRAGIHMGIVPTDNCVMEYIIDDVGHLVFVESVFPDGSIKVTQIGKHAECVYTEELLASEQYKELRPVFIQVL